MFNFTTQTVYNSIEKAVVNNKGDRVSKTANLIVNKVNTTNPAIRIGNTRFNLSDIEDIQVKNPTPESLAKVEFDLTKVLTAAGVTEDEAGIYRVALYVGLSMNSQDSFYSNDFVYKGKPLYIEFVANEGETAATVAKRVVANAKKFLLLSTQEPIFNVTADGNKVVFEGVNGYQQLRKAILQKYDAAAYTVDCCSTTGDFLDKIIGVPVAYELGTTGVAEAIKKDGKEVKIDENGEQVALTDKEVAILPGLEAFGDYNWIIHNLRLPTAANTNFWAPTRTEMPTVGQQYTQFIIRMVKQRDGIMGEIVGARGTSVTTHVLYVAGKTTDATSPAGIVNAALFTDFGASGKKKTEADDKLEKPFVDRV